MQPGNAWRTGGFFSKTFGVKLWGVGNHAAANRPASLDGYGAGRAVVVVLAAGD
jgi:hypothetical protein